MKTVSLLYDQYALKITLTIYWNACMWW
jgi:hypothetical protein